MVRFLTKIAPGTRAHVTLVYLGSSYATNFLCIKGPLLGSGVYHARFWLRTRPTCAEFRETMIAICTPSHISPLIQPTGRPKNPYKPGGPCSGPYFRHFYLQIDQKSNRESISDAFKNRRWKVKYPTIDLYRCISSSMS